MSGSVVQFQNSKDTLDYMGMFKHITDCWRQNIFSVVFSRQVRNNLLEYAYALTKMRIEGMMLRGETHNKLIHVKPLINTDQNACEECLFIGTLWKIFHLRSISPQIITIRKMFNKNFWRSVHGQYESMDVL